MTARTTSPSGSRERRGSSFSAARSPPSLSPSCPRLRLNRVKANPAQLAAMPARNSRVRSSVFGQLQVRGGGSEVSTGGGSTSSSLPPAGGHAVVGRREVPPRVLVLPGRGPAALLLRQVHWRGSQRQRRALPRCRADGGGGGARRPARHARPVPQRAGEAGGQQRRLAASRGRYHSSPPTLQRREPSGATATRWSSRRGSRTRSPSSRSPSRAPPPPPPAQATGRCRPCRRHPPR